MTDTANTIILSFPKERVVREAPPESVERMLLLSKKRYLNQVSDEIATTVVTQLAALGINIEDEDFQKHFPFTIECIRAIIFEQFELHHPLQEPIKQMVLAIEKVNKK